MNGLSLLLPLSDAACVDCCPVVNCDPADLGRTILNAVVSGITMCTMGAPSPNGSLVVPRVSFSSNHATWQVDWIVGAVTFRINIQLFCISGSRGLLSAEIFIVPRSGTPSVFQNWVPGSPAGEYVGAFPVTVSSQNPACGVGVHPDGTGGAVTLS